MLVTAVITTHKRNPEIVERALKSILNQTYKNIEVIVVDDSPAEYELREAVATMVQSYADDRVSYISHKTCQGACVARNTGINAANGEFIGFLDDDDEWLPEKIEEQLKGFTNDNIALVYCGNMVVYDDVGNTIIHEPPKVVGKVFDRLIFDNFIGSTSFPLIRKAALIEIGGFDPEMPAAQDYDVWLRLSRLYEVAFVDKPLVLYHFHSGEQISYNPYKKFNALLRIESKNKEYLDNHKKAKAYKRLLISPYYAMQKRRIKAVSYWLYECIYNPKKVKINIDYLKKIIKITFKGK